MALCDRLGAARFGVHENRMVVAGTDDPIRSGL
jgi:hypothetical protein